MEINSRENLTFKNLLRLTQKKYRTEFGFCIIEGEKLVREYVSACRQVFLRKSHFAKHVNFAANILADTYVLDDRLFDEVGSLDTTQGILGVAPIPSPAQPTFPFLVLDGVQDPGNVGTLLRTAAAFGFRTVYAMNSADVWSQKVIRAGAGAQFLLNVIPSTDFPKGCPLYVADLDGVPAVKPKDTNFGLVMGNEGQGVSPEIKALPHKVVTIPMDSAVESLNVAVAGGILMHTMFQNN